MRSWIALLLFASYCAPAAAQNTNAAPPGVLALVEEEPIFAAAFQDRYGEYLLRTGAADNVRLRDGVLQQMINDRLIVLDARAAGIETSDAYTEELSRMREKTLIETYLSREILNAVEITEEDVEEAFIRINTTITARHLYAATIEEAEALRDRLASGESFETLAREVFVDTALANSGGSIGSFTFDEMDPDFEDAAFALAVGEISRPVRTVQGYSVIQVTDRFTKPILTEMDFAARRPKLQQFVLSKEISQARSHFVRGLSVELNIRFHEDAFARLLGQITGTGLLESMEGLLQQPLVSFGSETWTVDQFRSAAGSTDPRQRAGVRAEADLKEFISGLVVRAELLLRAEKYAEDGDVAAALVRAMDEWILDRKKLELASVVVSEDSVRSHFDRHPEEFTGAGGERLNYESARPSIIEQLRLGQARRDALDMVARLRKEYRVEVYREALLELEIAGRTFADAGRPASNVR
ncbi:MAG: peptidylprolyl isomerase [Rhodothermales bacterium]